MAGSRRLVVGVVAIAGGIVANGQNVAFLVALAFAVAASANLPTILYSLFWSRFTTTGALCSIYGGLVSSLVLIVFSPAVSGKPVNPATGRSASMLQGVDFHWFPLDNPGIVSIPLSFLLGALGTLLGGRRAGATARRHAEMEVRALTGAGAEWTGAPCPGCGHHTDASAGPFCPNCGWYLALQCVAEPTESLRQRASQSAPPGRRTPTSQALKLPNRTEALRRTRRIRCNPQPLGSWAFRHRTVSPGPRPGRGHPHPPPGPRRRPPRHSPILGSEVLANAHPIILASEVDGWARGRPHRRPDHGGHHANLPRSRRSRRRRPRILPPRRSGTGAQQVTAFPPRTRITACPLPTAHTCR